MNYCSKLRADESGQTLITAAPDATVMTGFLGLSLDIGQLRFTRGNQRLAARNSLLQNGMSGITLATNCVGPFASGITLAANYGTRALRASHPNQPQPTYFARALGYASAPTAVHAIL